MKNQKGFTVVEGLLILIIVGIIVGVGWYVWQAKEKSDKSLDSAAQTNIAAAGKNEEQSAKIPEDYVQYLNKEVGFSFAYPKDWGTLVVENTEDGEIYGHYEKGQDKYGNSYRVSISKKTMQHADTDSPTANVYGYNEKNGSFVLLRAGGEEDPLASSDVLTSSSKPKRNYIVYRGEGLGYFFNGYGKLENNEDYDSVEFSYIDGRDPQEEEQFEKNDSEVEQLIKILETFQNL